MSHAFLDAYDRMDDATFEASLAGSFDLFEDEQVSDREYILHALRDRKARGAPLRTRTWTDEHVVIGPDSAVFVGSSHEHIPTEPGHPTGDFEGWSTLVWTREGGRFKVAHWQWEQGGLDAQRARWDYTYRRGQDFTPKPNQLLVDTVRGRKPGRALDVAMGQGRNSVYLATQGWKVTGIDISAEGLRRAREDATKRGVSIDAIDADMDTWDFGTSKWDLVVLVYAGGDPKTVEKVKASLRPGGLLVAEAFAENPSTASGPGIVPGLFARLFGDDFVLLRDEVVDGVADWGMHPTKLVRFVAQKKPR